MDNRRSPPGGRGARAAVSERPTTRLSRGHLEQRSGAWWVRLRQEVVDRRTGEIVRKPVRVKLGRFRSKAEAQRALDEYLAATEAAKVSPGPRITLQAFAARYDRTHVSLLRPTSARAYRAALRCHVLPELGRLPLHAIGTEQLQDLVAHMHAAGRSRATIRSAVVRVIQLLHQARRDGFAARAVSLRGVTLPRVQAAQRVRLSFDQAQIDQILAGSDARRRALYALGAFGGLRCGEILGLCWSDIDFTTRQLTVRQNAVGGRLGALKTAGSARVVPLLPILERLLGEYRDQGGGSPEGLLFATRGGKPLDGNFVRRHWWRPLLQRLGLPPAGLHALRHSTPRLLDAMGMSPEAIRLWLGHSNLKQTAEYLHLTGRDLRTQLDAALARGAVRQ